MSEIYTLTCERCGLEFEDTNWRKKYCCDTCRDDIKRERNRKFMQNKRHPKKILDLSIHKTVAMLEAYNRKHKTTYTYGQFVSLISQDKINFEE